MRKRKSKLVQQPTPKQRKARERSVRLDARRLAICNSLEFWERCHVGACRRNHSCRGDTHACFARHWRTVTGDMTVFVHAELDARQRGLPPVAAIRAALEARQRYLAWRA